MTDNASPYFSAILTLKRSVKLFSVTGFASDFSSVILTNLMSLLGTTSVVIFLSIFVYEYYKILLKIHTTHINQYIILISHPITFLNDVINDFSTIRSESILVITLFCILCQFSTYYT
jgi:hypothetical protein